MALGLCRACSGDHLNCPRILKELNETDVQRIHSRRLLNVMMMTKHLCEVFGVDSKLTIARRKTDLTSENSSEAEKISRNKHKVVTLNECFVTHIIAKPISLLVFQQFVVHLPYLFASHSGGFEEEI